MPTDNPSPLDTLQAAFDVLATGPRPLALDGRTVGHGLPGRLIPLDELRGILLDPTLAYATRDAAVRQLVLRARSEPAWIVGLAGVLLPGLRRIAGRVARDFPGDTADIDAEILAGLVEAVHGVDADGPRMAARLLAIPWNRAKVARRAELANWGRKVVAASSAAPARPWGHPDFVLERAVAEGAITAEESELIGATRLGGDDLAVLATQHNVPYGTLRRRRFRAERRLTLWISNGSSTVPDADGGGICRCGSASGRRRPAAGRCAASHHSKEVSTPRPAHLPGHRSAPSTSEHERSQP